jgi:inosine/xanthosine triphosphate pyrophosphatase family protein
MKNISGTKILKTMARKERLLAKVQERKTVFKTVIFVVNAEKTISCQHQNLTGFIVGKVTNVCMNSVPCMDLF